MNNKLKFESSIDISEEVINKNFHKCRLKIMHDGMNNNGSIVPLSAIEDAKESIKNTPIMAFIKRDDEGEAIGFGGHESELQIKEKDGELYLKEFYNQVPIGIIPETNNAVIEEIDGKNYLLSDGFIWKSYSNEAYDMLVENGTTNVSCEMQCKSLEFDENDVMSINKFEFLGLVVIGVDPGMTGANIDMDIDFSLNDTNKETFSKQVNELNSYLTLQFESNGKEESDMEDNKKVEETEIEETKEVFEQDGEVQKEEKEIETEDTKVEFGLSIDNLRASISSQLKDITTICTNYWGESYECRAYYLETILPEDKIVVLEDYNDWNKHYGVSYSMNGDNVVLDFDTKVEYIQEWREKSGTDEVITFEREDVVKDIVLEKFAAKETEIENLTTKVTELEEFKANYEKEVKLEELTNTVEEVVSKFSFDEEEIAELKAKAINEEIDMETFEEKLFALEGRKAFAKKTKFSKEEEKTTKIEVKAVELQEETVDEVVEQIKELKAKFGLAR